MSFDEFNKLFCKGMFKQALIETLDQLNKEGGKDDDENDEMKDAKDNFFQEMPLSLKIDGYQRDKMLRGIMSPPEST